METRIFCAALPTTADRLKECDLIGLTESQRAIFHCSCCYPTTFASRWPAARLILAHLIHRFYLLTYRFVLSFPENRQEGFTAKTESSLDCHGKSNSRRTGGTRLVAGRAGRPGRHPCKGRRLARRSSGIIRGGRVAGSVVAPRKQQAGEHQTWKPNRPQHGE